MFGEVLVPLTALYGLMRTGFNPFADVPALGVYSAETKPVKGIAVILGPKPAATPQVSLTAYEQYYAEQQAQQANQASQAAAQNAAQANAVPQIQAVIQKLKASTGDTSPTPQPGTSAFNEYLGYITELNKTPEGKAVLETATGLASTLLTPIVGAATAILGGAGSLIQSGGEAIGTGLSNIPDIFTPSPTPASVDAELDQLELEIDAAIAGLEEAEGVTFTPEELSDSTAFGSDAGSGLTQAELDEFNQLFEELAL